MVLVAASAAMILAIGAPGVLLSAQSLAPRIFGALLTATILVGLAALWRIRVRVRLDPQQKVVVVERTRWPLSPRSAAYPLSEVMDVAVEKSPRGTTCRLALVLSGGLRAPLTESYFGSHRLHARAADAIRELLRDVE
jgi:hypothetical protein